MREVPTGLTLCFPETANDRNFPKGMTRDGFSFCLFFLYMTYPLKKKGVNIYLWLLHLFFGYFPQEYVIYERNVFWGSGFQDTEHLGGEWETFMSRTLRRLGRCKETILEDFSGNDTWLRATPRPVPQPEGQNRNERSHALDAYRFLEQLVQMLRFGLSLTQIPYEK